MINRSNRRFGAPLTACLGALTVATALLAPAGAVRAAPSRAELEAARERLMELERDFELVVEEYNLVHEELTGIQFRIGETELAVQAIERRMGGRQDAAIALARELYMSGSAGAVEAVLSSKSISEVEARLEYLRSSEEAQAKVFESLAVDRVALDINMRELDEDRGAALAAEQRLVELQAEVEAKLAAQKDEIAELNAAIERAERRAAAQAAADAAAAAAASVGAPAGPIPKVSAPNPNAQAAVDAALSQLGKPYQWGADGPDTYDCSGLTLWAWAHAGVSLPHNSGMQFGATPRVAQEDWAPGDLLFFGSPIHHVGMYIGEGKMVEAPYTGSEVRINSAIRSDYVGAGRPGF